MANVLQFAIYAAYAGRLETAFLTDEVGSANAVLRCPAQSPASPTSPLAQAPQADPMVASAAPQPAAKVCRHLKPSGMLMPAQQLVAAEYAVESLIEKRLTVECIDSGMATHAVINHFV